VSDYGKRLSSPMTVTFTPAAINYHGNSVTSTRPVLKISGIVGGLRALDSFHGTTDFTAANGARSWTKVSVLRWREMQIRVLLNFNGFGGSRSSLASSAI